MVMGLLIFAGSLLSVEAGISVALIEIVLGVVAGNLLSVHTTPWIDYLAGFGSIVLTFLAGAEVDTGLTNLPIGKLIMASTFITNFGDRKSTRLNSSHSQISYAVFCLKKKNVMNNVS